MPDHKLAFASTGDVMAAMAHRDACAEVQNITSETLNILIVVGMALLAERGSLSTEKREAIGAVVAIAEQRARAAHAAAKAVAQATEEALHDG